jgi:hypothetical protein
LPYILSYSTTGGEAGYTQIETAAHGVSLSLDTVSVTLPPTLNPGLVRFFISWAVPAGGSGSITVRVYECWLEASE